MLSIKKRIFKVEWQIAIREKTSNDLDFSVDKSPFLPIPNTHRYWAADPFLIDYNGKTLLFVELYDRLKRKGLLGYMDITNGVGEKYQIVYEANCHLSYPMVFIKHGALYAIPESFQLGKLLLLKWNDTSCKFELTSTFMGGELADTNFISWNNVDYMLSTPIDHSDNVSKLNLYKHVGNYEFEAFRNNPVVDNRTIARNGGMIISHDGEFYRVSQDCGSGYGCGLNILHIDEISELGYKETLVKRITPQDIFIKGVTSIDGIHTYNSTAKYEVIDFKINYKFSLAEIVGYFLCKFKLIKLLEHISKLG